jgi:uncharacterized protein
MQPLEIIKKYYAADSVAYSILVEHSTMVAGKAIEIARGLKHLTPDLVFIEEAAMLHDIGIFMTNAPRIGCHGEKEYICHGYLGRALMEQEGLQGHALVCERHVGAGLSKLDISEHKLPLPERDMMPVSLEEKIICFADKFFSKKPGRLKEEMTLEKVRGQISHYGKAQLEKFEELLLLFQGR